MKNSNHNMMKIIIINNNPNLNSDNKKNSYGKTEINLINLINEFCETLKEILEKYYLNKPSMQLITKDSLKKVSNDVKFIDLKNKLGLLQVFSLKLKLEIEYCEAKNRGKISLLDKCL
jgi:hypothetical protein